MNVIQNLAERFPQLYLKPEHGVSKSELYRAIVGKGQCFTGSLSHFIGSPEDSHTLEATPAGSVEAVFLKNREDFLCFYRIMACRCEPVSVPATMGSSFISGFNDWSKIRAHMSRYIGEGGKDTEGEFKRFTSVPANYKGTLLLLSDGPYSALPPEHTPYSPEEWLRISRDIRMFHEITHFVCRRLYPDKKQPVWDELLADCMGLLFAVGKYDILLAQAFLGIRSGCYVGGRLENYLEGKPDEDILRQTISATEALAKECALLLPAREGLYNVMLHLEENADRLCPFFFA